MAEIAISYTVGFRAKARADSCPRGEGLTITITALTAAGAAASLVGQHVILALDVVPTTGNPSLTSLAGDATGISVFHIHGTTTAQWPESMKYEAWTQDDTNPDDPFRFLPASNIKILPVVDTPVPLRVYFGAAAAGLTGTSAIEAALQFVDTESGGFNFTVAPANQKLYYGAPVSWGIASASYNGTTFAELTPRVESLHDQHGDVIPYYLHESVALYTGV
jgi:hypothetical protein